MSDQGEIERAGYQFKMYLPGALDGDEIIGRPETGAPGVGGASMAAMPDSENCESLWCAYAWPTEHGVTGTRAFFINQEGEVLQTANMEGTIYAGPCSAPAFDAAYSDMEGFMDSKTLRGMGASLGREAMGHTAGDGNVWSAPGCE